MLITDPGCRWILRTGKEADDDAFRASPGTELQELLCSQALSSADAEQQREAHRSAAARGYDHESRLLLASGGAVSWRSMVLSGESGEPTEVAHLLEWEVDVSAAVARPPDPWFRLSFENTAAGMAVLGPDGTFLRANPSLCRMLGYTEHELTGLSFHRLLAGGDGVATASSSGWETLLPEAGQAHHADLAMLHRDGIRVWAHLILSAARNSAGGAACYIATVVDISERRRLEEDRRRQTARLFALASTDPLTGLQNHRAMQECLQRRVAEARGGGEPVSLLLLDLDHFRALNEEHGHDAGDRALRRVGQVLRGALRSGDVACRHGGEEFALILRGAGLHEASQVAERVRGAIAGTEVVAVGAPPLTCSVGIAMSPAHASTADSLLKAADLALYRAKRAGRNRVDIFRPEPTREPDLLLHELRRGLRDVHPDAVAALMTAIDLRDRYTGAHCQRVARLASNLAARMDYSRGEQELIRIGAPLLDIGKIALPDALLTKPGRLTPDEWRLVRQHPLWGEQLVRSSALPSQVGDLVRWHHERLDGSGYPDGLTGDRLPRAVKLVAVADVAIALRDNRPHRRGWSHARVRSYLQRESGRTLDAEAVAALISMEEEPPS